MSKLEIKKIFFSYLSRSYWGLVFYEHGIFGMTFFFNFIIISDQIEILSRKILIQNYFSRYKMKYFLLPIDEKASSGLIEMSTINKNHIQLTDDF